MREALFSHKRRHSGALSGESIQKELDRLCDSNALPKLEISTAALFSTVEKNFRSYIDREISMPFMRTPYLYLSDEGFLIVFTVLYSISRAACAKLTLKAEESGEHAFLILEGKTDKNAKGVEEALMISSQTLAMLGAIAKASGFSVGTAIADGILRVRFSFLRFRAVPISAYSCSEDYVLDRMHRAFQLFMRENCCFFDFDEQK